MRGKERRRERRGVLDVLGICDPAPLDDRRSDAASRLDPSQGVSVQSLQALSKTHSCTDFPDRDAQFQLIKTEVETAQAKGQPVISVDTRKKALVGDFKNGGHKWQLEPVRVHDFAAPPLPKPVPYGAYDITSDEGRVSVGIDHGTARFAVESIRRWNNKMGTQAYPNATELIITADRGGSNNARTRVWKV